MNCGIKTHLKMADPSSIFQWTSIVFRNIQRVSKVLNMTMIFILSPCSITHKVIGIMFASFNEYAFIQLILGVWIFCLICFCLFVFHVASEAFHNMLAFLFVLLFVWVFLLYLCLKAKNLKVSGEIIFHSFARSWHKEGRNEHTYDTHICWPKLLLSELHCISLAFDMLYIYSVLLSFWGVWLSDQEEVSVLIAHVSSKLDQYISSNRAIYYWICQIQNAELNEVIITLSVMRY